MSWIKPAETTTLPREVSGAAPRKRPAPWHRRITSNATETIQPKPHSPKRHGQAGGGSPDYSTNQKGTKMRPETRSNEAVLREASKSLRALSKNAERRLAFQLLTYSAEFDRMVRNERKAARNGA